MVFKRNITGALHTISDALLGMHGIKSQERSWAAEYSLETGRRGKQIAEIAFMQQVVDILMRERQGIGVTLDQIILRASDARPLMSAMELADFRGLTLRGVIFTQKGVDLLRAMPSGTKNLQLDLRGADIRGSVFKPASTFDGVLIDEATVGMQTNMRHLTFDEFDHKANIHILKGDVSFLHVMGATNNDASKHANILLGDGVIAQGLDISKSAYTALVAGEDTCLAGMTARGARALKVTINASEKRGTDMRGANFSDVCFAPGSAMRHVDLTGADFSSASLGDIVFAGSRLVGANLKNVDISHGPSGDSPLKEAIIDPTSLVGAIYNGKEITREMAQQVHRKIGVIPPGKDVTHDVILAQDKAKAVHYEREEGPQPYRSGFLRYQDQDSNTDGDDANTSKRGAFISPNGTPTETIGTDNLLSALCQVNELMSRGGVTRKCGYDRMDKVNSKVDQAETNCYRNGHEEEWSRGGPAKPV